MSLTISRDEAQFLEGRGFDLGNVFRVREDTFTDGALILSRQHRLVEREVKEFDTIVDARRTGMALHAVGNREAIRPLLEPRRRAEVEITGGPINASVA